MNEIAPVFWRVACTCAPGMQYLVATVLATLLCSGCMAEQSDSTAPDPRGPIGGKGDDPTEELEEAWSPVRNVEFDARCGSIKLAISDLVEDSEQPYGPPASLEADGTFWTCDDTGCTLALPRITFQRSANDSPVSLCLELDGIQLRNVWAQASDESYKTDMYVLTNPRVDPGLFSAERHFSAYGGTGEVLCRALGMPGGSYYERASSGGPTVAMAASGSHAYSRDSAWIQSISCRRYVADRDALVY